MKHTPKPSLGCQLKKKDESFLILIGAYLDLIATKVYTTLILKAPNKWDVLHITRVKTCFISR